MATIKNFDIEFKIVTFTTITDGPETGGVEGVWKASVNGHELARETFGFGRESVMPIVGRKPSGSKILYDEVSDGLYELLDKAGAFSFARAAVVPIVPT